MPTAPFSASCDAADLLSTGQAARRLGCSETWIRKLVLDGRLPAVVTPLGRLIDGRDLEALASARSQRAGEASHA